MKKLLFFTVLLLGLVACKDEIGDKTQYIEVLPKNRVEIPYGVAYHETYTTTDPVYLKQISYGDSTNDPEVKHISRTDYENPPYEVKWEGIEVKVHSLYKIEVWIAADSRPSEADRSSFTLDIDPIQNDFSWWVDDIVITRTQPAEE